MSSRGLGQFSAKNLRPGTIAMIVQSTTFYRYTFATDTIVSVVSPPSNTILNQGQRLTAFGNDVKGMFAVISWQNGFAFLYRIVWAAQKALKNFNLVPSNTFDANPSGAGNAVMGVITTNNSTSTAGTTNTVTYAGDVVAAGTTLTASGYSGSAVATPSYALFSLTGTAAIQKQTNKYFFAGNSVVSGTNLTLYPLQAAAIGNADVGIFSQGGNTTNTCKYVHSNDTTAASTNLAGPYQTTGGWNNDVSGRIKAGASTASIWTFANDTVGVATVSISSTSYGTANGIPGVSVN
jgi:hypothetical protein